MATRKSSRKSKLAPAPSQKAPAAAPQQQTLSFDTLPKVENHALPLLCVDAVMAAGRSDDLATLRFFAFTPNLAAEVSRIQMSASFVRKLIDTLCRMSGYYPTQPMGDAASGTQDDSER